MPAALQSGKRRRFPAIPAVILAAGVVMAGGWIWKHLVESTAHPPSMRECHELVTAIETFILEYDHLPLPKSTGPLSNVIETTTGSDSPLIAILLGEEESLNPKKVNFLGDPKDQTSASKPRNGLIRRNGKTAFVDAWGHPFHVRLILNTDGQSPPPIAGDSEQASARTIVVWSAGPDGDPETRDDNVSSRHP